MTTKSVRATNCSKCGVEFSDEHPRCRLRARWAVCRVCYNEHNKLRRRKGRPAPSLICTKCGVTFTEDNPRIEKKKPWCRLCFNATRRDYHARNADKLNKENVIRNRRYRIELKKQVFDAYGNICLCCGMTDVDFLTLQHIEGGGSKHKAKRNILGMYIDIIRAGFPKDKYGLMCSNCNFAEGRYGECPHETRRKQVQLDATVLIASSENLR